MGSHRLQQNHHIRSNNNTGPKESMKDTEGCSLCMMEESKKSQVLWVGVLSHCDMLNMDNGQ